MDTHNYDPNLGTPLYDQTAVVLATVLAKAQEFEDNGVPCRTVTLLITDGNDEHSHVQRPGTINKLVTDMLKAERHIIGAMGISDGSTDFGMIFSGVPSREIEKARKDGTVNQLAPKGGMGIHPAWVLTPGSSQSEIRLAFQVFSQSAVRASQGAKSFSQAAAGGFGQ